MAAQKSGIYDKCGICAKSMLGGHRPDVGPGRALPGIPQHLRGIDIRAPDRLDDQCAAQQHQANYIYGFSHGGTFAGATIPGSLPNPAPGYQEAIGM
jgi:hypothetical protein